MRSRILCTFRFEVNVGALSLMAWKDEVDDFSDGWNGGFFEGIDVDGLARFLRSLRESSVLYFAEISPSPRRGLIVFVDGSVRGARGQAIPGRPPLLQE